jgi:hypothetical protein
MDSERDPIERNEEQAPPEPGSVENAAPLDASLPDEPVGRTDPQTDAQSVFDLEIPLDPGAVESIAAERAQRELGSRGETPADVADEGLLDWTRASDAPSPPSDALPDIPRADVDPGFEVPVRESYQLAAPSRGAATSLTTPPAAASDDHDIGEPARGTSGSDPAGGESNSTSAAMLAPTSDGGPPLARPMVMVTLTDERIARIREELLAASAKDDAKALVEIAKGVVHVELWWRDCQERAILGTRT